MACDATLESISLLNNDDCAGIIDFSTFYRNGDFLTTIQNGGKLAIWNIESDCLINQQRTPFEISAVKSLSNVPILLLGDNSGYLHIYDTISLEELRLIKKVKLFCSPLDFIKSDQSLICMASKLDSQVYFISTDPLNKFEIFAWTDIECEVDNVVIVSSPKGSICLVSGITKSETMIMIVHINGLQIEEKCVYNLNEPIFDITLIDPQSFIGILESGVAVQWKIDPTNKKSPLSKCDPRMKDVTHICLSHGGKNLAVLKSDGTLSSSCLKMEKIVDLCGFPPYQMDVKLAFSFTGRYILMATDPGSLYCLPNKKRTEDSQFSYEFKSEFWKRSKLVSEIDTFGAIQPFVATGELDFEYSSVNLNDMTWLEKCELEQNIETNSKYSEQKRQIRSKVKEIANSIAEIRQENGEKEEIEQLDLSQMVIDAERQSILYEQCDNSINQMKLDFESTNEAKEREISQIKLQYWDNYEIKSQSLLMFKGNLEVCNFPVFRQSDQLTEITERIDSREQVVITENKLFRQLTEDSSRVDHSEENPCLMHSQFYPQSMEYRFDQINRSESKIKQIKLNFNNLFDETLQLKRQALILINQKLQNKAKILKELAPNENFDQVCGFSSVENPSEIFQVSEEEIVKRMQYVVNTSTVCDKGGNDNDHWRERGLKLMMDGVLEVKKEFVRKEPEMPSFMSEKEQTKWTVEELQLAEEYNHKMAQSMEEYEQHKKILENEVKKNDLSMEDVMAGFDEKLQNLFKNRINSQSEIFQEELCIARMKRLILVEQELDFWQVEMRKKMEKTQKMIENKNSMKEKCHKIIEGLQEEYDVLIATDKMLEKSLKTKFDASSTEKLLKIFKRRPKLKLSETEEEVVQSYKQAMKTLEESNSHTPEDLEAHVWEKFCLFRKQKLESEYKMRQKYISVAEAMALQGKTSNDIEDLQKVVIPDILRAMAIITEKRNDMYYNLEIQFEVKQGQVEINVENGIRDYSDAVLLQRSIVEELNADIKKVANMKVTIMKEGKDVMNSIAQLEWEHKKLQMQYDDIINRMREIKNFKVSRDMHKVITNSFSNVNRQDEISALEQAIVKQQEHGVKVIDEKQEYYSVLKRENRKLLKNNDCLLENTFEVGIEVSERKINYGMTVHENENNDKNNRYSDIVNRRRMVDKINENASQIATLRQEAERLRMASYPSLI